MSWFNQKDWSTLAQSAKVALSTAQKTIDKALDINDEDQSNISASAHQTSSSSESRNTPVLDTDSFFSAFLNPVPANDNTTEGLQPVSAENEYEDAPKTGSPADLKFEITMDRSTSIPDPPAEMPSSESGSKSHRRTKSAGNGTNSPGQSTNTGMSSCSESIEVLSLISSEKLGESYYRDFGSPPKLTLKDVVDKNSSGSSDNSDRVPGSQLSPNSDDAVELASSTPDESEMPSVESISNSSAAYQSLTDPQRSRNDTLVAEEGSTDGRVTSWFMVSEANPGNSFPPDLVPDEQASTSPDDPDISISSLPMPDIHSLQSHPSPDIQNTFQSLPDIQNDALNATETNDAAQSAIEPLPNSPDITNTGGSSPSPPAQGASSTTRPDIFPLDESGRMQPVDVVVQELDVISAIGDHVPVSPSAAATPERRTGFMADSQSDESTIAGSVTGPPLDSVDVVMQELDVVQGSDLGGGSALDLLPANADPQMSIAVDAEHLTAAMDRNASVIQSQATSSGNDIIEELLKKVESLEETLQAREQQLMAVNRRATDAQEENEELKCRLEEQQSRHDRDLAQSTDSFNAEIHGLNVKLNSSQQTIKDLQKQLNDLRNSSSMSAQLAESLKEKDHIIEQLTKEGEKLAQEEYKKNSVIKKLKSKEKELQTDLDKTKIDLRDRSAELESVTESFSKLQSKVSEQRDTINSMNSAMSKNEDLLKRRSRENEELLEKCGALQNNLDSVFKELREAQKQLANQSSLLEEAASSQSSVAEEQVRTAVERARREWEAEREVLLEQMRDVQTAASRAEAAARRREDQLKDELKHANARIEEEMERSHGFSEGVSKATQPLWSQIQKLQRQQADQNEQWNKLETSYQTRISDAEAKAGEALERERLAQDNLVDYKSRIATLDSQLSLVRSEHSKISRQLDDVQTQLENCNNLNEKLREEVKMLSEKLTSSERRISVLQSEVTAEKSQAEAYRRKLTQAEETNRDLTAKLAERMTASYPTDQTECSSPTGSVPTLGSGASTPVPSTPSNPRNVSSWEFLESQVKLKGGEASALQGELRRLEKQNISLREEFVKLSNERHRLLADQEVLDQLKLDHTELQARYETLLTMYGEKAEEVDELRMDLQDVKGIYKAQLEELMRKMAAAS